MSNISELLLNPDSMMGEIWSGLGKVNLGDAKLIGEGSHLGKDFSNFLIEGGKYDGFLLRIVHESSPQSSLATKRLKRLTFDRETEALQILNRSHVEGVAQLMIFGLLGQQKDDSPLKPFEGVPCMVVSRLPITDETRTDRYLEDPNIPIETKYRLIFAVINKFAEFQRAGVIKLDISSDEIAFDSSDGKVSVADFGLSVKKHDVLTTFAVRRQYLYDPGDITFTEVKVNFAKAEELVVGDLIEFFLVEVGRLEDKAMIDRDFIPEEVENLYTKLHMLNIRYKRGLIKQLADLIRVWTEIAPGVIDKRRIKS